jgi:phage terminase large subunit-like protein
MSENLLARKVREAGGLAALVDRIGPAKVLELTKDWRAIARPEQIPPGELGAAIPRRDWRTWLLMAGRGFGKTRTGAQTVNSLVNQGRIQEIALIAPTLRTARRKMVEDRFSGLIATGEPGNVPSWNKSDLEVHWPNGAIAYIYTAEEPDGIRSFNGDFAWCEEVGAWQYPNESWSNLQLGLRIRGPKGDAARAIITTTPRPIELIKRLVDNPTCVVTGGTTFDNADNLDPGALKEFVDLYEGTRIGRQELLAILLGDTPGALWTLALIEKHRVKFAPDMLRLAVGVDPAVKDPSRAALDEDAADNSKSAETGLVSAGVAMCKCKGGVPELHGFVLEDGSEFLSPKDWAERAVKMLEDRAGDRIVAEENQGGALVESNLRTLGRQNIPYRGVNASKGKVTRAEPIAALYEQGKVHHVGSFGTLEDQMSTWQPLRSKKSPDRMDALVWVLTDLMLGPTAARHASPPTLPTNRRRI